MHHDIKSSNIFMTQLGDVAIGDFGLASIETSHLSESTSYSRGTYAYMAPEILFRDRKEAPTVTEFNPISDIWSLGIVLLEMSLGRQKGQDFVDSLQEKADIAAETGQVTVDQFHEYIDRMMQNLVLTESMDKAQWIVVKMVTSLHDTTATASDTRYPDASILAVQANYSLGTSFWDNISG